MNQLYSTEEWMEHVKKFKDSGLSINHYCRENNLKPTSFRHWVNKERKKALKTLDKETFVRVGINNAAEGRISRSASLVIKYKTYEIILTDNFSSSDLSRVLDVLEDRRLCSLT